MVRACLPSSIHPTQKSPTNRRLKVFGRFDTGIQWKFLISFPQTLRIPLIHPSIQWAYEPWVIDLHHWKEICKSNPMVDLQSSSSDNCLQRILYVNSEVTRQTYIQDQVFFLFSFLSIHKTLDGWEVCSSTTIVYFSLANVTRYTHNGGHLDGFFYYTSAWFMHTIYFSR